MSHTRRNVSSGSPFEPRVGMSRAVRLGPVVSVAGTAPIGPDGRTVGQGDPAAQARRCLEIIHGALQQAGATLQDVVRTRILLTRIEDWDAVAAAHGEVFRDIRPANTIMQVSRFIDPEWLVEIEADAVVGPEGFDTAIADYYERTPEEARLSQGPFQLEEARTRELIQRFAAPPPGVVVDIGGAAGAYALWLAEAGYAVHLLDRSPRLVAEARRRSAAARRPLVSCRVADARALDLPPACADLVLLLGPLYHLTDAGDRGRALMEAARLLKPGARLFAAALSRWASALDGLARDLLPDPRFAEIVERDLRTGQHRNPTERADYFTTAYFHHPEELAAEVKATGLALRGVFGLEGPGWMLPDVPDRMAEPARRETLLGVARMLETEPCVLGCSAHLLAVAERQL